VMDLTMDEKEPETLENTDFLFSRSSSGNSWLAVVASNNLTGIDEWKAPFEWNYMGSHSLALLQSMEVQW
jgi:hypothetical protein